MDKPKPVAVTAEEGGDWISWDRWTATRGLKLVHSIKFDDGTVWDAVNGWRRGCRYVYVSGLATPEHTIGSAVHEVMQEGFNSVSVSHLPRTGDGNRYRVIGTD